MAAADSSPSSRLALLAWVAAFVVHRALLLVLGFDGVYFWEEAYRLLAAEALAGGWNIPLHDLQADPYSGGSLVFAALTAVVASVAGPSLLVLKATALAWHAAGLALWLLVADRTFGRRAAHALGLVWLAAPPVFVVFDVVAMGFHGDTVTLAGLQLLLMFRYLDGGARSAARLALWMAAAGLSVWFSYASALSVAASAGYVLLRGDLPPRLWGAALAGLVAGFSPWLAYNMAAGGSLEILGRTFAADGGAGAGYFTRLVDITVRGVPAALYFRDIGIPGDVKVTREWLAYPYLAVYAASFLALAADVGRRLTAGTRRRLPGGLGQRETAAAGEQGGAARWREAVAASPELAILAVFPLFLLVLPASNQEFNDYGAVRFFTFRVLVPALPSVFFAIALAMARSPLLLRAGAVVLVSTLALVGSVQLLAGGSARLAGREAEARRTGAEAMGHLLVFKHGTSPLVGERIGAIPDELRASAWRGAGFSFAYLYGTKRSGEPPSRLAEALAAVDAAHRADGLAGARLALGPGLEQVPPLPSSPRREALGLVVDQVEARWREGADR